MESITLYWQGPFPLFNPNNGETVALLPEFEGKPGIYLWCSRFHNEYRVNYVGQSKYLANRFREHIVKQLSGAYLILDSAILETQGRVEPIYKPDDDKWMVEYLKKFNNLSVEAYRNLILSVAFVAVVETTHISMLKSIESAIINSLNHGDTKVHILNTGLSKLNDSLNPIQIVSRFHSENVVVGMNNMIEY